MVSDNPEAFALERAARLGLESALFTRAQIAEGTPVADLLRARAIDYIVLAGFLRLVPAALTREWGGRMVNIHPALLPKFGGKGMYGDNVHRAVIAEGEKESGITIHLVNEHYDSGDTLAQYKIPVLPDDTPEALASRIHELEYKYFPLEIEKLIKNV